MRIHVAFTPGEAARVPTGIVVDVLRATSTIVQALDAGYRTVYCCAEVDEAEALRDELGDAVLGGE
ncbi:MAG TPA: 2-phosphosulfolactate phosphatase, partial [Gaiellaceae bacterium]|nr:2-phosphosulfolactate phosphatase [Gaiellaceae bacterium]